MLCLELYELYIRSAGSLLIVYSDNKLCGKSLLKTCYFAALVGSSFIVAARDMCTALP